MDHLSPIVRYITAVLAVLVYSLEPGSFSFVTTSINIGEQIQVCPNPVGGNESWHEELRDGGARGVAAAAAGEQRPHPPQGGGRRGRAQAQVVAGGAGRGRLSG